MTPPKSLRPVLFALALLAGCADPAQQPVSHWVAQLRANDADERAEAREWLAKKGKEAVPEVAKLLADGDTVVAMSAADVLAKIGPDALPALVEALGSGPPSGRRWAAHALGEIGPPASPAVPALQTAAREPDLKSAAEAALRKINP